MKRELNIRLTNSATAKTGDRWAWAVWLEGDDQELDQVESVTYLLHPTYKNPERVIDDRSTAFRLESNGWGEFMIHAKVATTNGTTFGLDHWLRLAEESPARPENEPTKKPRSVFLSYANIDLPLATKIGKFLRDHDVKVVTGNDVAAGESFDRALESSIGHADAVVALVPNEPNRWVDSEIEEASKQGKSLIPVVLGTNSIVPQSIQDLVQIQIPNPEDQDTSSKVQELLGEQFGF